jgi:hypothetical protein
MKDAIDLVMQSRVTRVVGALVGLVVASFVAGYILFGPIALRLLPR